VPGLAQSPPLTLALVDQAAEGPRAVHTSLGVAWEAGEVLSVFVRDVKSPLEGGPADQAPHTGHRVGAAELAICPGGVGRAPAEVANHLPSFSPPLEPCCCSGMGGGVR